tara:strand:- start:136 stop:1290 length:1155 start_codon:yes stop_codon:yes gene_type:complete
MKKLLLLSALLIFALGFSQTYIPIPDQNFEQALIDLSIDSNPVIDGQVLYDDISQVTNLSISYKDISDLTGIQAFYSLERLQVGHNNLTSLTFDPWNNTSLTHLYIENNQLTNLSFPNNPNLLSLYARDNELTNLNIASCTSIGNLDVRDNLLTNLNIPTSVNLQLLYCSNNQLTTLNIGNRPNLRNVLCENNEITFLDFSNSPLVNQLYAQNNQLTNLSFNNNNNTNLLFFDVRNNNLTSIDLRGISTNSTTSDQGDFIFWAADNPNLVCIFVDDIDYFEAFIPNNVNFIPSSAVFVNNEQQCATAGTEDLSINSFSIYPNPTKEYLNIDCSSLESVSIYNILGKELINNSNNRINVSSLSKGVYFIKVSDGINASTKKFIKD